MALKRAISKELSETMMLAGGYGQKTMTHLKVVEATPGLVIRERSHMTSARFWQIPPPPVSNCQH